MAMDDRSFTPEEPEPRHEAEGAVPRETPEPAPRHVRAPGAPSIPEGMTAPYAAPAAGEGPQAAAPVPPADGPVPPMAPAPVPGAPKKGHPFLSGILGGVVGMAVTAGVVFAVQSFVPGAPDMPVTSGNGSTVNIQAAGDDITLPEAVAAKCLPSVASLTVESQQGAGSGSGVVFDEQGNILTNYHVVEGAQSISVTVNNKSYEGTLVGSDASSDLAVVHIDLGGDSVTPMAVGDSSKLVVGQWVMSLGSPFGLDQSVSTGVVSSLYRSTIMEGSAGNTIYTNLVQTDAAINPGNSGGALVNANGELVGINSMIMSASGSSSGVGFAIPSNYAAEVAKTIIAGKEVEHAFLGANVATVTAQVAARNHLAVNQGAYVVSVVDGGPAANAGLQEGDIVTQVGDEAVSSADGLILAVRSHKVGDKVQITYYRGSEKHTVEVPLGSDASGKEPERQQSVFKQ